ncbi:MAG: hypothetical protein AAB425_14560 [Bdellovibrionota bacterium]
MRTAAVIATITLLGAARVQASMRPEAQVKAAKGPVQITLSLQKTTVKVEKSLWYKIELKNIGKKKLRVDDWIFKDPYAMHVNSRLHNGIYLEIIKPDGKPLVVRPGNYSVSFDWEPKGDEILPYTPEERKEIADLRADWNKRGLTAQQQSLALNDWSNNNNDKKNQAELSDPAKQLWLKPGASTTTFAWSDRGPGEHDGRSDDDKSLRGGYTELWVYWLLSPGKYRIRAVYDREYSQSTKKSFKKHGIAPDPGAIAFKTAFLDFVVLP